MMLRAAARGVTVQWRLRSGTHYLQAERDFIEWATGRECGGSRLRQNLAPVIRALFEDLPSKRPESVNPKWVLAPAELDAVPAPDVRRRITYHSDTMAGATTADDYEVRVIEAYVYSMFDGVVEGEASPEELVRRAEQLARDEHLALWQPPPWCVVARVSGDTTRSSGPQQSPASATRRVKYHGVFASVTAASKPRGACAA